MRSTAESLTAERPAINARQNLWPCQIQNKASRRSLLIRAQDWLAVRSRLSLISANRKRLAGLIVY